jgi:hypothetical protein
MLTPDFGFTLNGLLTISSPESTQPEFLHRKRIKIMKKVKGTTMMYFVKTIRANKSGVYDRFLTGEDRAIIGTQILPAIWYPYETFKRCFLAVFDVIAKRNLEEVREWGSLFSELIMTKILKNTTNGDKPLDRIRRLPVYINAFYNIGDSEVSVEAPNRVSLQLHDCDPDFQPLYYFLLGWFKNMAELCGAHNVRCEFINICRDNKSNSIGYLITWE